MSKTMRVALVHDWLVGERGGERVLARLCHLYPEADIFTLVYEPSKMGAPIVKHRVVESFIAKLRTKKGRFRHLLPLFGYAVERFDLRAYDLVISTSHCVAHGVRTHAGQRHVAYIHTPMRYLYDQLPHYLPAPLRTLGERPARLASWPLRVWDHRAAQRPDVLVANSHFVAQRIGRVWERTADVIHPPVDVDDALRAGQSFAARLERGETKRRGLVFVGALVPYKRAELAVALARELEVPLTIVGQGSELAKLRALAPPWVHFVAGLTRGELSALLARSEAMVFAGEEDFGIAPVEAMAAGTPVLGVRYGGLCESIVAEGPEATGVLCPEPTLPSLVRGFDTLVRARRAGAFAPQVLQRQAARFAPARFDAQWRALMDRLEQSAGPHGRIEAGFARAVR